MYERSTTKSLLTVFWFGNTVIFAFCQHRPPSDLLFCPVHLGDYHSFLEVLFINSSFRKFHKRKAGYLSPFHSGGSFVCADTQTRCLQDSAVSAHLSYSTISFHLSFPSLMPDLVISNLKKYLESPYFAHLGVTVLGLISRYRHESPCSLTCRLCNFHRIIELLHELDWQGP